MRIKERRESVGLTRVQVADRLGVSAAAVRKWEVGMARPSAEKLPLLADLLRCSIDALFGRSPPDDTPAERRENHECQS